MIPRIIHQTWRTDRLPERFAPYAESWSKFNPDWRQILWTDRMLLEFVETNYPDLFDIFCGYRTGVMRADAARYMLLHAFGGVYADVDVECVAPLASLEQEDRVVLCHEPPAQWARFAPSRGHPYTLFNGVMAGPSGHALWRHLIDRLPETRYASNILDATGPCLLTGVYLGFEPKESVRIEGCHLFTPTDDNGRESPRYGMPDCETITKHHWAGTWYDRWEEPPQRKFRRSIETGYHRARIRLTRGPVLTLEAARASVDATVLERPAPAGDKIAILVPARDAIGHIDPFIAAVGKLDLPQETIKLVFCEGDSEDGTGERLEEVAVDLRRRYRDVIVLHKDVTTRVVREQRWDRKIQRARRAGIAKVRNHLIDHGLDETDDWSLWIDIDVWRFPSDVVQRLRATRARIVVPHCVTVPGGRTFDLNSFVSDGVVPEHRRLRNIRDGISQPPPGLGRLHMESLRHTDRVMLDGVGGTMLLVDASLHRGGLRFPEIPYKDLIETEAFGVLAGDLGVRPVGLPRLEILHVPY